MTGLTLAAALVAYLTPYTVLDMVSLALTGLFFGYATWILFRKVLRDGRVDLDTIFGAVCVYLLIGIDWGIGYGLMNALQPGVFAFTAEPNAPAEAAVTDSILRHYLYYSFTTLSSVGAADIVPKSSVARYATMLEAIFGQLYVSVLWRGWSVRT